MPHLIRRRRAAALTALIVVPALALITVDAVPAAHASDPQLWPVAWDLNPTHDVEELSRVFDQDEDGHIDPGSGAATRLPEILNAQEFSLHAKACAAPPGPAFSAATSGRSLTPESRRAAGFSSRARAFSSSSRASSGRCWSIAIVLSAR